MKTHGKMKGRQDRGRFVALPIAVLESPDFLELSHTARTALIALLAKYNGRNNGDLSLPFSRATLWGINSKTTLAKALKELIDKGLICRSRDALKMRDNPHGQCSLYALMWVSIDDCGGKHELSATSAPLRSFSRQPEWELPR